MMSAGYGARTPDVCLSAREPDNAEPAPHHCRRRDRDLRSVAPGHGQSVATEATRRGRSFRAAARVLTPYVLRVPEPDELMEHVDATVLLGRLRALEAEVAEQRIEISELRRDLMVARHTGAAVGMVMALFKISESQALAMLQRAGRKDGRDVNDVADDVVRTGDLPYDPGHPLP